MAEAGDAAEARREAVVAGFRINHMTMREEETGAVLWERSQWAGAFEEELQLRLPRAVLACRAVSREMNFTSAETLRDFRLRQVVMLHGHPIEQWDFDFGFVIPGSTNSWQCTIEAGDAVIPAEILSGNVVIETTFLEGDTAVGTSKMRVFYD